MAGLLDGSGSVVSGLFLKDYVNLPTWLEHFPRPFEARRDDKAITGAQGLGVTFMVTQNGNALHDLTVFVLGVIDCPLANSTFPYTGVHLPTGAVVVVVDNLFRAAFEHLFRGRAKTFSLGIGSVEVDYASDAHLCYPPEIAACVVRKIEVYVY